MPIARAAKSLEHVPRAILVSTAVRLVLVGLAALGAGVYGRWAGKVVAIWFIVFYLTLLAVETGWAVRLVNRQFAKADGSAST